MMVRPPHFRRHASAAVAQRLDGGGEQQRLRRRDDFGPVALLRALRPEDRKLRRIENAAGDVAVRLLQLGDLRGEVVGQWRIKAEIVYVKTVALDGGRQP